jgi:DNA-binding NarL/FixJ family response regulator
MNEPIRVLIADDNAVFRQGLCRLLASDPEIEVVGEAEDGIAAVEQALACAPDVVLMDIRMPGQSGLEAARQILVQRPRTRIIVLTAHDSPALRVIASDVGVISFLAKKVDSNQILYAIHASTQER